MNTHTRGLAARPRRRPADADAFYHLAGLEAYDGVDEFEDFVAAPRRRVFAVFADPSAVEEAVEALHFEGIDDEAIWVLHGPNGLAHLDATGRGHGWLARLLRLFQGAMDDGANYLGVLDEALRDGRAVVSVRYHDDDQAEVVARLLSMEGGEAVARYRQFGFEAVAA
jgi:hypothetical protein